MAEERVVVEKKHREPAGRWPAAGEHILAYQGHPTFPGLLDVLRSSPRPVRVYGLGPAGVRGDLHFKEKSEAAFLDDLPSCRYVIAGAGHTAISEALFYGKPVLSFPIQNAFEQFLNAFYLERLGYGRACARLRPDPTLPTAFEADLPNFEENLAGRSLCGNQEIFALMNHFIQHRNLPPQTAQPPA